MVKLLQNTSNSKKVQDKETLFLPIYLSCFWNRSAYADDTTFFLSDEDSVIKIMNAFDKFSLFSGFKLKKEKCEIVNIDALKGYHCYSVVRIVLT